MTNAGEPCAWCGQFIDPLEVAIALDLDGTLLGAGDRLPRKTRRFLARWASLLAVVTGRPVLDAQYWARLIRAGYVVALNGAAVISVDGRLIWAAPGLPDDLVDEIARRAVSHGATLNVHTAYGWHPRRIGPKTRAYARRRRLRPKLERWEPGTALQAEIVGEPDSLDAIAKELPAVGPVTATRSQDWAASYLDVAPHGITKAVGFDRVLAECGGEWQSTIAIGDGDNDADLFRRAGTSIALAGATAALMKVATYVVDRTPEQEAVRIALAALLEANKKAGRYLRCLHCQRTRDR